jgi:hypothetical protein
MEFYNTSQDIIFVKLLIKISQSSCLGDFINFLQ